MKIYSLYGLDKKTGTMYSFGSCMENELKKEIYQLLNVVNDKWNFTTTMFYAVENIVKNGKTPYERAKVILEAQYAKERNRKTNK